MTATQVNKGQKLVQEISGLEYQISQWQLLNGKEYEHGFTALRLMSDALSYVDRQAFQAFCTACRAGLQTKLRALEEELRQL